ncbi:MAG: hypothetical protein RQ745_07845 [Longimicrobiales bacterium]|nr:hypothetical protein [Longimicrobiales bacterium]
MDERPPDSIPRHPPRPGSPAIGDLTAAEALVALHDALDRRLLAEMKHGSPHWMALIAACFLITALLAVLVWDASGSFDFAWLLILPVPAIVIYINLIVDERRRRRPIERLLDLVYRIEDGEVVEWEEIEAFVEEGRAWAEERRLDRLR